MRCPKFFAHSRLHSRFLLCKNRCCDEPCFAARNRFVNSFTRPKSKNSPLSRTGFFRQFSLFCLVITSYNVKGYAAFHKLRPLMRCPKFFAHSRLHSRFLLCKNCCCDEPCFAARNRFVNPFTRPKSKNSPLSRTVFFRQFSLFCLVITSYNVKGYAAFHKTSTADAVPEVFCSLATSQSIFALQKLLLRRTLFRCAKQVR